MHKLYVLRQRICCEKNNTRSVLKASEHFSLCMKTLHENFHRKFLHLWTDLRFQRALKSFFTCLCSIPLTLHFFCSVSQGIEPLKRSQFKSRERDQCLDGIHAFPSCRQLYSTSITQASEVLCVSDGLVLFSCAHGSFLFDNKEIIFRSLFVHFGKILLRAIVSRIVQNRAVVLVRTAVHSARDTVCDIYRKPVCA